MSTIIILPLQNAGSFQNENYFLKFQKEIFMFKVTNKWKSEENTEPFYAN